MIKDSEINKGWRLNCLFADIFIKSPSHTSNDNSEFILFGILATAFLIINNCQK